MSSIAAETPVVEQKHGSRVQILVETQTTVLQPIETLAQLAKRLKRERLQKLEDDKFNALITWLKHHIEEGRGLPAKLQWDDNYSQKVFERFLLWCQKPEHALTAALNYDPIGPTQLVVDEKSIL
jgi:hypothetical protein